MEVEQRFERSSKREEREEEEEEDDDEKVDKKADEVRWTLSTAEVEPWKIDFTA